MEHAVAERKTWAKFGLEKGKKPGPDGATTTVGETVFLKLTPGNKVRPINISPPVFSLMHKQSAEPEQSDQQAMKTNLSKAGAGKVVCRICKGDHFTAKCPYKDSLAGLESFGTS